MPFVCYGCVKSQTPGISRAVGSQLSLHLVSYFFSDLVVVLVSTFVFEWASEAAFAPFSSVPQEPLPQAASFPVFAVVFSVALTVVTGALPSSLVVVFTLVLVVVASFLSDTLVVFSVVVADLVTSLSAATAAFAATRLTTAAISAASILDLVSIVIS